MYLFVELEPLTSAAYKSDDHIIIKPKTQSDDKYMKNIDVKKIKDFLKAIVMDIRTSGTEEPEEVAAEQLLEKLSEQTAIDGRKEQGRKTGDNQTWHTT